ncbi:MAG: pyridoxal 5'-phosphate synthase glutaminase subunit PdxT, partial [Candidatus Woesearchaeota archaeon]|nr:pyridoxal 5'-phosphate synthase glutaminase subunit PdxT [Candidatus Woesearchaeota archaeon]
MKVGILALQGDVREHARILVKLGAEPIEVKLPQ